MLPELGGGVVGADLESSFFASGLPEQLYIAVSNKRIMILSIIVLLKIR